MICNTCGKEVPDSAAAMKHRGAGKPKTKIAKCKRCQWNYAAQWMKAKRRSDRIFSIRVNCKSIDRAKGRSNDLTYDFIKQEVEKPCTYCGTTSRVRALDRKDSAIGHTMANSVACCVRCNLIKRDMPFAAWAVVAVAVRSAEEMGLLGDWCPGNFLKNTPAYLARAEDERKAKAEA